jgi:ATP-dependent helicase/nuclease subunit B
VHATFLIGPAGIGKSHRCLAEVRAELKRSPEGAPLLYLAPKQATFQIERELLSDPDLHGYTRLQILSFERLARFVLSTGVPSRVLSVEGRIMVLRALLMRHQNDLSIFRSSARLPGFARQISDTISELQSHCVTANMLLKAADKLQQNPQLAGKLRDLALIFSGYVEWLKARQLHDPDSLLDLGADALRAGVQSGQVRWTALWLDGFAELTAQETALLLAVLPGCETATLAFCADSVSVETRENDWLSSWSIAGGAAAKCLEAVQALPDSTVTVERLARGAKHNRFSKSPVLAHLESAWEGASPSAANTKELSCALRVVSCPNPETEATIAAQEILRHVRAGGRFRDCGVILRNLSGYHDAIRRVLTRYEIPFFIDRREPVAHHPLPELTRSALRLAALDWQLDDWLCVLKTGLLAEDDGALDDLENEALQRGWSGKAWHQPFTAIEGLRYAEALERFRSRIVPPFLEFSDALRQNAAGCSGAELAAALHRLWHDLGIMRTLDEWSLSTDDSDQPTALHATVWEQMQDWISDLGLAFADQRLELREWIAIVDAGLSSFTVGVVPPALDQVLVGTVDRSRNPNLELAIVLGMNETVFPAPVPRPVLLNESDREVLEAQQLRLAATHRARIGHERYYAYIAFTRPRRRLIISYSAFDAMDRPLNPSVFVSRLQRIFPAVEIESWRPPETLLDAEHPLDLVAALIVQEQELPATAAFDGLRARLRSLRSYSPSDVLSAAAVERLYGKELQTSVTSLERFGQCPFKFLVHSGLRAAERKLFQIDRKKLGDFQHRVLKAFHDQLKAEGKRWREITPADARRQIARLAEDEARTYHHGLFATSARERFSVRQLSLALQDFIEVIVGWMRQYQFNPEAAELRFGPGGDVPPWRLELSDGRALIFKGSVDRVDLFKQEDGTALCVVLDFKSSRKSINATELHNGVQMQLPAYLNMLRKMQDPSPRFGVLRLKPAGVFYVSLRGSYERGARRDDVLTDRAAARRKAYRHAGHFDLTALDFLDTAKNCEQFQYTWKQDGTLGNRSRDPMQPEQFLALLDAVEVRLCDFGDRIFAGEATVDPYRKGSETPCTFCDYRPICRIDPWSHRYRSLKAPPEE